MLSSLPSSHPPLHPLSLEVLGQARFDKASVAQAWRRASSDAALQIDEHLISELPVVASQRLDHLLQARSADLCQQLRPYLTAESIPSVWKNGCDADVLTVDYAVIADPSSEFGWNIRLVEFQAFTSILASAFLLHRAYAELAPALTQLCPWQTPPAKQTWLQATHAWLCADRATALLEVDYQERATSFDLHAAAALWDMRLMEPKEMSLGADGRLYDRRDGRAVERICNRLIMSEIAEQKQSTTMLQQAQVAWQNHPAWYFAVNKGLAPQLSLHAEPKNAFAHQWRSLGLPASQLVAKNCLSFAGKDILLHTTAEQLDSLPSPQEWLVQPRYQSYPLLIDEDGSALFAEIRLMMQIKPGQAPWTAMQLLRWYRGDRASASGFQGRFGEGLSVLYKPPQPPQPPPSDLN